MLKGFRERWAGRSCGASARRVDHNEGYTFGVGQHFIDFCRCPQFLCPEPRYFISHLLD
jgi:hypothetical protein